MGIKRKAEKYDGSRWNNLIQAIVVDSIPIWKNDYIQIITRYISHADRFPALVRYSEWDWGE